MNSPHLSRFPNYNRFDPPMALDFANWTRREARSYFDWFIDHIPERMNELRRFARFAMPDCDFDGLPDSLRCLGKLLIEHVATRPRTAKERADVLEDVPERLRSVIDEDDWELTDETISLCIDVGIYFAEVLRKRYPGLEWRLWTRRHVQQNRPVLSGFQADVPLDPVLIISNIAYGKVRGERDPNQLRDAFDIWGNMVVAT